MYKRQIVEKARQTPGPVLLEFQVEMAENVYPMVVPGQSLGEVMVG